MKEVDTEDCKEFPTDNSVFNGTNSYLDFGEPIDFNMSNDLQFNFKGEIKSFEIQQNGVITLQVICTKELGDISHEREEHHQYINLALKGPAAGIKDTTANIEGTAPGVENTEDTSDARDYMTLNEFVHFVAHEPEQLSYCKELEEDIKDLNRMYWATCDYQGEPSNRTPFVVRQIEDLYSENTDLINI